MPNASVRNGLYWSTRTRTYHYLVRIRGRNHQGDTGHALRGKAQLALARYRAEVAERPDRGAGPAVPTLAQALDMWSAAEARSLTAKHIADRARTVRRHCGEFLDMPLDRLDTAGMDRLRSGYLAGEWRGGGWRGGGRPRTPGGWNRVRRHIYALVNWCVDRELLAGRPFRSRPIKVQKKARPTLWPEAVPAFLGKVSSATGSRDVRTAIRLMVQLGLRENEALGARWECFDERNGVYCPPRTKSREAREIALPPGLLAHLRALHGEARSGLVLGGAAGEHGAGFTRAAVARAGKAVGIAGLHPHALRATFATAHWEAGTPMAQITAMLGHRSPNTTMGYIRQRPRGAAEAQSRVAAAMGFPGAVP